MAPAPPRTGHKPGRREPHIRTKSQSIPARPFVLASVLHPLRSSSNQWLALPTILMAAFLFRWAVSLGPYSGMATPPMYGDLEAQRHWMEITTTIPMSDWYWHDIEWWGLDYPPLTAYHSWLCGKIGWMINKDWFALKTSRGMEGENLKVFMRATVAVSDYLTFVPAAVLFARYYGRHVRLDKYDQAVALAAILMQPSNIIVDYGHFQYNNVMLGLTLLAIANFFANRLLWGSLLFVMALNFKQMALYYAPAIFAYLLGLCVQINSLTSITIDFFTLILLGVTVVASFLIMILPFAIFHGAQYTAAEQLARMVHRVFPFARGLWEDKVANFWCATNLFIKYREYFPISTLQLLSLVLTLASILPFCVILFWKPSKTLLPWGLAGCSWGFFLFSFQVHEKSVLIPLMPTTILLAGGIDNDLKAWVGWINNIAMFSMAPLLRRDDLILQYLVLTFLWSYLLSLHQLPTSPIAKLIHVSIYIAAVAIHLGEVFITNDFIRRYKDIWVVANVIVSFAAFSITYLWVLYRTADAADLLPSSQEDNKPKVE